VKSLLSLLTCLLLLAGTVHAQETQRVCDPADWAFAVAGGLTPDGPTGIADTRHTAQFIAGDNGAWVEFSVYTQDDGAGTQFAFWRVTQAFSSGYTVITTPTVHEGDPAVALGSTLTIGRATDAVLGETFTDQFDAVMTRAHAWDVELQQYGPVWVPPNRALQVWVTSSDGAGYAFRWREPREEGVLLGCDLPTDLPCDL
jgi:hypothetical protein